MIEVMVAAAILIVGLLATLGITDAASSTASTAQRTSAADAIAQREIEGMHALPYAALYDCSAPVPTATDARRWVTSAPALLVQRDYRRGDGQLLGDVPSGGEPFWTGTCTATAGVEPGPSSFSAGPVQGQVDRFVTAEGVPCASTLSADLSLSLSGATGIDASAGTSGLAVGLITNLTGTLGARVSTLCQSGAQEAKRLTVAVAVNAPSGEAGPHQPIYLSSIVADPATGQVSF
jgi:hypothetical protein